MERRKIDLAQCTFRHALVDTQTILLLAVGCEVLHISKQTGRLDAAHHTGGDLAEQLRILGIALRQAPCKRIAVNVDARTEDHVDAMASDLTCNRFPAQFRDFRVPRAAKRNGWRIAAVLTLLLWSAGRRLRSHPLFQLCKCKKKATHIAVLLTVKRRSVFFRLR